MLNKKTVNGLRDLQGKKVLIHCDFNVPLKEGVIQSYNRIDGTIPIIKKLPDQGVKIILCFHLGKPEGEPVPEMSLAPVALALSERLDVEVKFVDDPGVTGSGTRKVAAELGDREVLLLQNTRYKGEEARFKGGDTASEAYARGPADLYDGIFINDTFDTAHRVHCSNIGVTKFTRENAVGYLMKKEIKFLRQTVENPVRPLVVILGGTKVPDRINVINSLLDKADTLTIGGGMAYTFAKAQGREVGNSLCEVDKLGYALEMIKKAEGEGAKLLLPVDHAEGKEFSDDIGHKVMDVIDTSWSGFDIEPKAITLCKEALQGAEAVMWNGPTGMFEFSNFAEGALEICHAIVDLAGATAVIGGGNSVNAVKRLGFADKMAHISTDGGAPLEFLKGKELSGTVAADNKA